MLRKCELYKPKTAAEDVQQKRHATLLLPEIDVYVRKAIDSVDNLNVDTARESIALLAETNAFANDLQTIIYGLTRIVIKTFKTERSNQDVAKIVKNFTNYVYSIQKSYNTDINVLKRELKSCLEGVSTQARPLYNLLETEPTYINDLVTIIDDVLFAIRKVYYRNIFENKSQEELKNIEVDLKNKYLKAVENSKEDDATMNNVVRYIYHAACHMNLIVRILDEEADGYNDELKSNFMQIAFSVSETLSVLDNALKVKEEPAAIKESMKVAARACRNEMITLISLENPYNSNEKIFVHLNNLIVNIIAHHYSLAEQNTQAVDHINQ